MIQNGGGDPNDGLSAAISASQFKTAEYLVQAGATATSDHVSRVAGVGNIVLLKVLIEEGQGDPNDGLGGAIAASKSSAAEYLIQAGATASATHVKQVATAGNKELMKMLLEEGQGDANDGLAAALGASQFSMAEFLIKKGAQPDGVVKIAVEQQQMSLLLTALDTQADPAPGLAAAINDNATDYAKLLIERGAPATEDSYIATAAGANNLELVNLLLAAGGSAQAGMNAAVNANAPDIVGVLISSGAKAADDELLSSSVVHNNVALTKLLVEAGGDPSAGLEDAVRSAPLVLEYFVAEGVDVSDQAYLNTAIGMNNAKVAKILMENGCNPLFIDASGNNYLHRVTSNGGTGMINLLVGKGVDINATNGSGQTPLHIAVKVGRKNLPMVQAIINAGADVNVKNRNGETARDLAKGSKIKRALKKA